ncbi:MAG: phage holin family protein [Ramlibacter sp.]
MPVTNPSQESAVVSPPLKAPAIGSLFDAANGWVRNMLQLAVLEGKEAAVGLAVTIGLGVAAFVLLITGWLALLACAVTALVENDILGMPGSLLLVALLNVAGAAGLGFLVMQRGKEPLFCATRRQLAGKPSPGTDDG